MQAACVRGSLPRTGLFCIAFLLVFSLVAGCGGSIAVDLNTIAAISAPSNVVRVNQTLQLNSQYMASGQPVVFSVNGIPGGNSEIGTVSSKGVYTAPAVVPTPYTVQITSSIAKYPGATPGSVTVQVWNPIPGLNAVTPGAFSEGVTTVTVNGSQFVYGAQISWNGAFVDTTYVSPHRACRADCGADPWHLSPDGHQSQSRIGNCAASCIKSGSRPGGPNARAKQRH